MIVAYAWLVSRFYYIFPNDGREGKFSTKLDEKQVLANRVCTVAEM